MEKMVNRVRSPALFLTIFWFLPTITVAQTQDIHALKIVTQAFDKAKNDNKTRRETMIAQKVHWIGNLKNNDEFESFEKVAVYKAYTRAAKEKTTYVEELIDLRPDGTDPPENPIDFERLLDEFLIRSYFLINPETESISGRTYLKIHFWPRENLPPERENIDRILSRAVGIIYIDERTYVLRRVNGHIEKPINVPFFYNMERLDFNVEFSAQNGLVLIQSINAVTKYQYRKPGSFFRTVKRFQIHKFWHDYADK